MNTRLQVLGVLLIIALTLVPVQSESVGAAGGFADPSFQSQWQAGESVTPNFWGPLSLAKEGQQEQYAEAAGGQRLVQYFDKGRMELTNGVVTNGLLATELITGKRQFGDDTFQAFGSANVPVAGDSDNIGPTYAAIRKNGDRLLGGVASQVGAPVTFSLTPDGAPATFAAGSGFAQASIAAYDDDTRHNVPAAFADYRNNAGIPAIGLAIAEPFWANVKVGGERKNVLMQAFQRRVLTFTSTNPSAFQVEMGNIGQHYYQWRYSGGDSTAAAPVALPVPPTPDMSGTAIAPVASAPQRLVYSDVMLTYASSVSLELSFTTNQPACITAVEYRLHNGTQMWTEGPGVGDCTQTAFHTSIQGLTLGTTYDVRIYGHAATGSVAYSNIATFSTIGTAIAPAAPGNPPAASVNLIGLDPIPGPGTLKALYQVTTSGQCYARYRISSSPPGPWTGGPLAACAPGQSLISTLTGLKSGTTYEVQMVENTASGPIIYSNSQQQRTQ